MDVLSRPGRKEGKKEGEKGKKERNERGRLLGQSGDMHIGRTHQALA